MRVKYKKKWYVMSSGMEIELLWNDGTFSVRKQEIWKKGTVQDLLSAQFTSTFDDVDGNPLTYRFYDQVGIDWRPL